MYIIGIIMIIIFVAGLSSNSNNNLNNHNKNTKNNSSIYSDEELVAMGLLDEEKDEVKNGNYDPWQFEEDEIEEDDYYYEDN